MRVRLVAIATLLAISCASPREKAYKAAMKDYQRANQATVQYARTQVKQLVVATQSFRTALSRWPQNYNELVTFAVENQLVFNPYAFNEVSFAMLPNASAQIRYDVNCAGFDTPQYKFSQSGTINVKAR